MPFKHKVTGSIPVRPTSRAFPRRARDPLLAYTSDLQEPLTRSWKASILYSRGTGEIPEMATSPPRTSRTFRGRETPGILLDLPEFLRAIERPESLDDCGLPPNAIASTPCHDWRSPAGSFPRVGMPSLPGQGLPGTSYHARHDRHKANSLGARSITGRELHKGAGWQGTSAETRNHASHPRGCGPTVPLAGGRAPTRVRSVRSQLLPSP